MRLRRLTLTIALATGLLSLSAIGAGAGAGKTAFTQTNLVSNRADQGAGVIDPSLQNPGGSPPAAPARCGCRTTAPASPPSIAATVQKCRRRSSFRPARAPA